MEVRLFPYPGRRNVLSTALRFCNLTAAHPQIALSSCVPDGRSGRLLARASQKGNTKERHQENHVTAPKSTRFRARSACMTLTLSVRESRKLGGGKLCPEQGEEERKAQRGVRTPRPRSPAPLLRCKSRNREKLFRFTLS